MVASVIPVSAPLALIVKCAAEAFWEKCLEILFVFDSEDELARSLGRDTKWDKTPERQVLRQQAMSHGLPWSSFQILLRHIYRNRPQSPREAQFLILELSGMEEFENALDRHFFKQSAVIRQRQTRARSQKVLRGIYDRIDTALKEQRNDLDIMEKLIEEVARPDLVAWLERKSFSVRNTCDVLMKQWETIDREVIQVGRERDRDDYTLELVRWLDTVPDIFSSDQLNLLRKILESMEQRENEGSNSLLNNPLFISLFRQVAALCSVPAPRTRQYAEWLRNCLMQFASSSSTPPMHNEPS